MSLGIIIAFMGMLSFGVGDSLFNIPAKKYKEETIVFWQYVFILLFSIIFLMVYFNEIRAIHFGCKLLFPLLAGLGEVGGVFFLIKSLKKESLGLSIAIASAYPLSMLIYSYFIFNERIGLLQIISVVGIIFGLSVVSLRTINLQKISFNKNLKFAFLAFLSWSMLVILQKYSTYYYSSVNTTFIMEMGAAIIVIGYNLFLKKNIIVKKRKDIKFFFLIAFFLFFGILLFNTSLQKAPAGIVTAIIGSSAMVSVIIGRIFYKEKLLKHQYFGVVMVIFFLFILNLISN